MNVQSSMQNRGQDIKRYSSLLKSVCTSRNKMAFLAQNLLLLSEEIFQMHNFQVAFHDYLQESVFLVLLMAGKGQGLHFTSKKRAGLIFDLKKGQNAVSSKKRKK